MLVLLAASDAWALKPQKHRDLAEAACNQVGLDATFCRRMGKAVFETDYMEWDDLSAHAQTPRGGDRCSAADASVQRVDALARAVVAEAHAGTLDRAAEDLGRALHTLQDECAHHGMTNEQHAYFSLEQTCGDSDVSPDIQPDAIACAQDRTNRMMALVAPALAGTDWYSASGLCEDPWNSDRGNQDTCMQAALPTPFQACDFLALHSAWDGTDSTWNASVVGAALESAFAAGLRGDPVSTTVCGGDSHAIDPLAPAPLVTTPVDSCTLTAIGCFGKVDGADDNPNVDPYGDPATGPSGGGCNTGGGGGWLAALLALYVLTRR